MLNKNKLKKKYYLWRLTCKTKNIQKKTQHFYHMKLNASLGQVLEFFLISYTKI